MFQTPLVKDHLTNTLKTTMTSIWSRIFLIMFHQRHASSHCSATCLEKWEEKHMIYVLRDMVTSPSSSRWFTLTQHHDLSGTFAKQENVFSLYESSWKKSDSKFWIFKKHFECLSALWKRPVNEWHHSYPLYHVSFWQVVLKKDEPSIWFLKKSRIKVVFMRPVIMECVTLWVTPWPPTTYHVQMS